MENPPLIIPICNVHLAGVANDNVSGVQILPNGSIDQRGAAVSD